jgi:hypothetical protein
MSPRLGIGSAQAFGRFGLDPFAFFLGEDGLTRGVGLLHGALRMDAAEGVGTLAANGAKLSGSLREERLGLLTRHGVDLSGHGGDLRRSDGVVATVMDPAASATAATGQESRLGIKPRGTPERSPAVVEHSPSKRQLGDRFDVLGTLALRAVAFGIGNGLTFMKAVVTVSAYGRRVEENISPLAFDEAKTLVRQLFDRSLRHVTNLLHAACSRARGHAVVQIG